MGDPAGIGPELILKAFRHHGISDLCKVVVIGSTNVLEYYGRKLSLGLDLKTIGDISEARFSKDTIHIVEPYGFDTEKLTIGRVNSECGKAAVIYTETAGRLALSGEIDAIVSAPLNKEAMHEAGYDYEGQTQILAELSGARVYGMILVLGHVRVMMLTTHIALRRACEAVTEDRVYSMLRLSYETLRGFGFEAPRIAVAALNPHGGEGGLFGTEEIHESIPAIERARKEGIDVKGPVPADVVFLQARDEEYDLVLAMYHDQANMAAKMLGFGEVVTVLAGLPIIRTSVGHGTAFDIAGKGIARENNFVRAIETAVDLARGKKAGKAGV